MLMTSALTITMMIILTTTLLSTPLSLGLLLLSLSLVMTLVVAYSTSPFIAVMMFLIYIGGVMMMFAYFIAATPKSKISQDSYPMKMLTLLAICSAPAISINMSPMNKISSSLMNPSILLPFQTSQITLILMLMLVLFLAMMIIVKIATLNSNPLRPFK